jgi:hypothetical protein
MTNSFPLDVRAAFEQFPKPARKVLFDARDRIFALAETAQVGPLTETLKWGQPAYLTEKTKAGSTIRLGLQDGAPAAFFTCSSSLVDGFRADFPNAMTYHGNRALTLEAPFPVELDMCLTRALTYHRAKRNL